jgi:hypothetical protein
MAYTDPPQYASDNVSPVTASQNPATKLTHVGTLTNGLPSNGGQAISDVLVTRAYNLLAYGQYRRELLWDTLATIKPTALTHRGAVAQWTFVNDLDDDPDTAMLPEDYDVLPTPLKSWKTDITLREYGRAVTSTALLRGTTMIPVDPIAAERVGRNMRAVMDRAAFKPVLLAGGVNNDGTVGGVPVDVTVTGKPSDTLRAASQKFKESEVPTFGNGLYKAIMSPAAETALRKEADAAGWRYWQINQEESGGSGNIRTGYVGTYEGFDIMVANTPGLAAKGAVFMGAEALGKMFSTAPGFGPEPQVVVSPVVDKLKRFASVGWYHMVGYARFRAEAVLTGNPAAV